MVPAAALLPLLALVAPALANEIVEIFLGTPFEGGRHEKRIEELAAIEAKSPEEIDAYLDSLVAGITARASQK